MEFAKRLRGAMRKRGITQSELARKVGVSQPTVFGWLGGAEPKMSHYRRVVAILPEAAVSETNGAAV